MHGYLSDNRDAAGRAVPAALVLYTSTDDGATFDQGLTRTGTQPGRPWFFLGNGVVADDGTFVALAAELDKTKSNMSYRTNAASAPSGANGTLAVIRSRDGGLTVEASTITDVYYDWRVPQLSMSSLAVDRSASPFNGRLYAAWPDARADQHTQVFAASSDDLGRTWTAPRVISDDAGSLPNGDRPNHFMPMVAVNKDGVVAVAWHDRRDNPDNLGYFQRLSASLDGGATWLPSIRVSSSPNVAEAGELRVNGGDTSGLTADAEGVFHALWIRATAPGVQSDVDGHRCGARRPAPLAVRQCLATLDPETQRAHSGHGSERVKPPEPFVESGFQLVKIWLTILSSALSDGRRSALPR